MLYLVKNLLIASIRWLRFTKFKAKLIPCFILLRQRTEDGLNMKRRYTAVINDIHNIPMISFIYDCKNRFSLRRWKRINALKREKVITPGYSHRRKVNLANALGFDRASKTSERARWCTPGVRKKFVKLPFENIRNLSSFSHLSLRSDDGVWHSINNVQRRRASEPVEG